MDTSQTHLRDRPLSEYNGARLIASYVPDGTIAIFIHGYCGDPIETWSQFHRLLPATQQAKGCDLLFYGYDGLRSDIIASAGLLESFLTDLLSNASVIRNASLPKSLEQPSTFTYTKVILIAHSLGAVILRWSLLDAIERQRHWLEDGRIKMLLYAPAHTGANVVRLANEVLGSGLFRYFSGVARFVSPLIDQLKPESEYLRKLTRDTAAAITKLGRVTYLKPQAVVIAERENIVSNIPFGDDGPPEVIRGTNHRTVCKPTSQFQSPLRFVLKNL